MERKQSMVRAQIQRALWLWLPMMLVIFGHWNTVAKAQSPGGLDLSLNPGTGANSFVVSTPIQGDGKIVIGGGFTSYNGTTRNRIARLNADGSLDLSFNPGTGANGFVRTTAMQSDGKIIIGGDFTTFNGTARNNIARLNTDGTLDLSFNPGTGGNNNVLGIAFQSDGKIIIVGNFTTYNGTARNRIARLNADGSLDLSFNPGAGASNGVVTAAIQSDGKIIIGGTFTSYNGTGRNRIARVNADGTLDLSFDPGTGFEFTVLASAIQSDGKIIVGGAFTTYNGTAKKYIVRVNTDGSLDLSFNAGTGGNNNVRATAIQSDGKIIIGGDFTIYDGTSISRIARLNANGSLDLDFNPGTGTDNQVSATSIQSDGKIIIGGNFTSYNGTTRTRVARVYGGNALPPTPAAALDLTLAGNYVVLPSTPLLNLTSAFTLECWINPRTSIQNWGGLIENRWTDGFRFGFSGTNPNSLGVILNGNFMYSPANVITPNTWQHVAMTYNSATSEVKMYVNGALVSTWSHGFIAGNTIPVHFGTDFTFPSGSSDYNGKMDEVRIWNRALCQTEIQGRMNCEIPTTANGLLANYHFNQGVDGGNNAGITTLTDASGNGLDGTLNAFALNGATSNWVAPGGVVTGTACSPITTPPVITCPANQVLNAGTNCTATATYSATATDNCSTPTVTYSPASGSPFALGTTTVTATATNSLGNSASCTFTVTVSDVTPPTVTCQAIQVSPTTGSPVTVTPAMVTLSATDNCGPVTSTVTPNSFTCAQAGQTITVDLAVTDANGNTSHCSPDVEVLGTGCNQAPEAVCQNLTVNADGNCEGTPDAADFNNGSSDPNGDALTYSVAPAGPYALGSTAVVLTVSDGSLSSSCTATVNVTDVTPPTAICSDLTLVLDGNGNASVTASQVNNGSTDNCSIAALSVAPNSLDCSTIGQQGQLQTISFVSDNSFTQSTDSTFGGFGGDQFSGVNGLLPGSNTYTLPVGFAPNPCQSLPGIPVIYGGNGIQFFRRTFSLVDNQAVDLEIESNADNQMEIYVNGILLGREEDWSYDNFQGPPYHHIMVKGNGNILNGYNGGQEFDYVPTSFPSSNFIIGQNEIVFVLRNPSEPYDIGGFSATVTLHATTGATTPVILTVTDASGNVGTCTSTVTVQDNIVPTISCPGDVVLCAESNGTAVVTFTTPTPTDNCPNPTVAQTDGPASGSAFSAGTTVVTFTATDAGSNASSCSFNVTVNALPTVAIDPAADTVCVGGSTVLHIASGNIGSTTYTWSPSGSLSASTGDQVTATPTATTTYTVTATDENGCTSTNAIQVVVGDYHPPVALCNNLTVSLDANGTASVTTSMVNNGSTDDCGIAGYSLSQSSFGCSLLNPLYQALSTNETQGYQDYTGQLATDFDVVSPAGIYVTDLGVFDHQQDGIYGGMSGNAVEVAIFDRNTQLIVAGLHESISGSADPLANGYRLRNVSDVFLPQGQYSIVAQGYNYMELNGNSDFSGVPSISNDGGGAISFQGSRWDGGGTTLVYPNAAVVPNPFMFLAGTMQFSTSPGITTTLTVTDVSGNSSTCNANVTVLDAIVPSISCPADQVLSNGPGCEVAATYSATATDNCGAPTLSYSQASGSTFSVGIATVTATATDFSGNAATCTFTVTVNDVTPPTIECAPDVTIDADADLCTGTTTLTLPTISDNCGAGNGLNFDGINDYVAMPNNALDDMYTGNMETWVKLNTIDQEILFAKQHDGLDSYGTWSVGHDPNTNGPGTPGKVYFRLRNDVSAMESAQTLSPGQWYHLAVTWDGSTSKMYIDGNLDATASGDWNLPNDVWDVQTALGAWLGDGEGLLDGTLDEFRIWNIERSQSDIQASMNLELNAQTDLRAVYHFNEGAAAGNNTGITTVTDDGGSSLAGTLTNFSLNGATSNFVFGNVASAALVTITNNAPLAYPVGNTTVVWTATDAAGNTATCTQTVTVVDNQAPVVTCQSIQVSPTTTGPVTVTPAMVTLTATDNCGTVTSTVTPNSFTCAQAGQTITVDLAVTDANGNTTHCSADVEVLGTGCNQAPEAVCQNLTVNADGNCEGTAAAADFDNGSSDPNGDPMTFSVAPAGPYALGSTSVVLTVSDGSLSSTCTASIQVNDVTAPTVTCPADMTVAAGPGCVSTAVVTYSASMTDNCAGGNLTYSQASGSTFNGGVTTVTVTANDANSNTATCAFTVTVTVPSPLMVAPSNSGDVCAGLSTASVLANAAGGTTGYTYLWSNGAITGTLSNVAAGTYTVTVTDARGCAETGSTTVGTFPGTPAIFNIAH